LPLTARLVDSADTFMLGSRLKMSCGRGCDKQHGGGDSSSSSLFGVC
jgi:hypothetical protein